MEKWKAIGKDVSGLVVVVDWELTFEKTESVEHLQRKFLVIEAKQKK